MPVPFRGTCAEMLVADFLTWPHQDRERSLHLCSAAITVMNSPSQEGGTVRVRRMGPSVVWVLLLAGFLLSAGCIGPLQQWGEETTFRPKATSFDPATL